MCTVSYIPKRDGGFWLTSNRDESTLRPMPKGLERSVLGSREVICPIDPKGGGTWIAASEQRTVCLLNGAYEKHQSLPPYRKSRGRVVLESFDFGNVSSFVRGYDFGGIEPHTLILWETGSLYELRWDGNKLHYRQLEAALPHIWSSVTLYSSEVIAQREQWYIDWRTQQAGFSREAVIAFHMFGGNGDPENSVRMLRPAGMQTVSITNVDVIPGKMEMTYTDLLEQKTTVAELSHSLEKFSML